jgi:hypothetical protein
MSIVRINGRVMAALLMTSLRGHYGVEGKAARYKIKAEPLMRGYGATIPCGSRVTIAFSRGRRPTGLAR